MLHRVHSFRAPLSERFSHWESFEFTAGINVVIGRNGSGKSTLLHEIEAHAGMRLQPPKSKADVIGETEIYTPVSKRMRSDGCVTDRVDIARLVSSSGEYMKVWLRSLDDFGDTAATIVIDEPETHLDIFSTIEVLDTMREVVSRGAQFIIATHHPVLIMGADSVVVVDQNQNYCDAQHSAWHTAIVS